MSNTIGTASQIRPGEHVLMMLHQHWIVFAFKLGYIFILVISTLVILSMSIGFINLFGSAIFWGWLSLYWLVFLTFIFLSWINDEIDLFIITDQRIIGIEQLSTLSRRVTECGLGRVQEVNAEVTGILQTVFQYWQVHIHTASENSDMIVNFAPSPVEKGNQINTIISDYRARHSNQLNESI